MKNIIIYEAAGRARRSEAFFPLPPLEGVTTKAKNIRWVHIRRTNEEKINKIKFLCVA